MMDTSLNTQQEQHNSHSVSASTQRLRSAWVQSALVTLAPHAGTSALPLASLLALLRSLIRTNTRVPDAFMVSLYANTAQVTQRGSNATQHTLPDDVPLRSNLTSASTFTSFSTAQAGGEDTGSSTQHMALGMLSPSQLQQLMWAVSQVVTAGPGALPPPAEWLQVRGGRVHLLSEVLFTQQPLVH
jgi:hypothetical protein